MKVPISAARAKLFDLADFVRTSDDTVVVLEQRGGVAPVALVRESRLAYLEARVEELDRSSIAPFKLAGSLSSPLAEDALADALREIRREWSPRPQRRGVASTVRRGRRRS